jgi:hypothetical protein
MSYYFTVLLNLNTDPFDRSTCTLTYDEVEGWLCATWQGYVDPLEAQEGAAAYLYHAAQQPSVLLLNDNSQLQGPWFDSLDWLGEVWVPQADRPTDTISSHFPLSLPFELQIFQDMADARQWLRACRVAKRVQVSY